MDKQNEEALNYHLIELVVPLRCCGVGIHMYIYMNFIPYFGTVQPTVGLSAGHYLKSDGVETLHIMS